MQSAEKTPYYRLQRFWNIFLVILLILGLLVLLISWIGYAGVGIFDTQAINLDGHIVATILAFGGLAVGAILWFLPLLQTRRFPIYPIIISLAIIAVAIVALNLVDTTTPMHLWDTIPWYTRPCFWEWLSFLGSILWILSLWLGIYKIRNNKKKSNNAEPKLHE